MSPTGTAMMHTPQESSLRPAVPISPTKMFVVKRSGVKQIIRFDKITSRISKLCYGLDQRYVDPVAVSLKVNQGIYCGVATSELDELAAQTCAFMSTTHPDYSVLAARICLSNLDKQTEPDFLKLVTTLREHVHPETGDHAPMVTQEVVDVATKHSKVIQDAMSSETPVYDFFGFKTLEKSYLLRINGDVVERPFQLLMRVAIGINGDDIDAGIEMFQMMARKKFTPATPTLFNSGTPCAQMSSCFLVHTKADSITGIFDTLKDCAQISKYAGGIGLSIHDIRAANSYIRGTGGRSDGIVPMLKVFNDTARYVNQAGRRKGSIAVYIEPWHADIKAFLDMKLNTGSDFERARDLFYALWVPDLFMKRVEQNGDWSLFCPNEARGLSDVYGKEFEDLYTRHEDSGNAREVVRARDLWNRVIDAQVETGTPYMLYKDAANSKSNHKHLGTIKSSNLCAEIMQFTSPEETAVCNLASVNLSSMVHKPYTDEVSFDFEDLQKITGDVTVYLNKVIDRNFYPIPEARASNMRHRPIGIGIQGLADVFAMMRIPFESEEACSLNRKIFETMYYATMKSSIDLAKEHGPYDSFKGSPLSEGKFQFDLWGVKPDMFDWGSLREEVVLHGSRNSLNLTCVPTASSASILGNNESFEAFTSNVFNRRVLAGEFPMVNKHLLRELTSLGVWSDAVKDKLLLAQGSVQQIKEVPQRLRDIYKTTWEVSQKVVINQSADRGAFICQSQSLNLHLESPSRGKLTSMHFYAWKKGLKTGQYYLRSRPKADGIKFTINQPVTTKMRVEVNQPVTTKMRVEANGESCKIESDDCLECSA